MPVSDIIYVKRDYASKAALEDSDALEEIYGILGLMIFFREQLEEEESGDMPERIKNMIVQSRLHGIKHHILLNPEGRLEESVEVLYDALAKNPNLYKE